jgi:AcrR family transcriptional regulator
MDARDLRTGYTEDVAELPSSRADPGSAARSGPGGRAGPAGPAASARPAEPAGPGASARLAGPAGSLRAEQVAQTRAALIAAGRRLFGEQGFAATSVDDLARAARVTTGALYHHFPTKTALFETVFEAVHAELMTASAGAARGATDELDALARGFDAFLDAVLKPDVQRILVTDAPAVLGLARFTELDERYAVSAIVAALKAADDAGRLHADDPETIARLLLGALVRGSMLIAGSADPAATRESVGRAVRALLAGFASRPGE